jgi:hypothetical protein
MGDANHAGGFTGPLWRSVVAVSDGVVARKARCMQTRSILCHYWMFVRFRQQVARLQVSVVENRRISGKVRHEHIGALGSVDAAVSIRERLKFWAQLPERLTRLGNRIGAEELPAIYATLHARIPMVTPEEQRAIQEANAKDDERFWDAMRDISVSNIEGHKRVIASSAAIIARETQAATEAAEKVEIAKVASHCSRAAKASLAGSARSSTLLPR